jgi:predicted phosphodiesterase
MKALIYSDIHLEFGKMKNYPTEGYDIVILAGDIAPGRAGIAWACQSFSRSIIVAGNHEFYGRRDITKHYDDMAKAAQQHASASHCCYFLQNDSFYNVGYRIIGATLWTDFQLDKPQDLGMLIGQSALADYSQILDGSRVLSPERVLAEHKKSLDYIRTELEKPFDGKTIVVTHHAPSGKSIHPRFANSNLNHMYCSSLDELIVELGPDLWVHGHVHNSMDYVIGRTRIVANPRGYMNQFRNGPENPSFDPNFIVEI